MNLFAAALALLRGGDSPARVGAGRPAVALPFAPPLGQPIRYRYDSTRQRNGMDQITQPTRLGDLELHRTLRLRLDINRTGQWARLHMTSASDAEAVRAIVADHLASMLQGTGIDVGRAAAPIRLTETATQLIGLPSGLVQRATWQRRLTIPGHTHRLETRNIRRLE
jgi:hypothetical protein